VGCSAGGDGAENHLSKNACKPRFAGTKALPRFRVHLVFMTIFLTSDIGATEPTVRIVSPVNAATGTFYEVRRSRLGV
jgi:hypothetical protein